MIKIALNSYRKNIWHFFTLLGFVALGVIIGIAIVVPNFQSFGTSAINDIKKSASVFQGFNGDKFITNIIDQFKAMNWSNPIDTITKILDINTLTAIINNALSYGGLTPSAIISIEGTISNSCNTLLKGTIDQTIIFVSSTAITSIVGYFCVRTVIQMKETNDFSLPRYITSLILCALFLLLSMYLIVLTLISLDGPGMYFALIGCMLFQVLGDLVIAFLLYRKKGTKLKDILNLQVILVTILSNLIIVFISFAVILLISYFNGIAGLLIGIPLMLITYTIIDTNVFAFVSNFDKNMNNNLSITNNDVNKN